MKCKQMHPIRIRIRRTTEWWVQEHSWLTSDRGDMRFREGRERDEGHAIRQGGELWNDVRAEAKAEDERKCEGLVRGDVEGE